MEIVKEEEGYFGAQPEDPRRVDKPPYRVARHFSIGGNAIIPEWCDRHWVCEAA